MRRELGMLLVFASLAAWGSHAWGQACVPLPQNVRLLAGPLTIEEVEATSLEEIRGKVPPEKFHPFGFAHEHWLKFKAAIPPGAQLWKYQFSVPPKEDGERGYSEGGLVVLTLDKCYVSKFLQWLT